MSRTRVVVTGIGLCTPIGHNLAAVSAALRTGKHGIGVMPEWAEIQHLRTRLGAPARMNWSSATRCAAARPARSATG